MSHESIAAAEIGKARRPLSVALWSVLTLGLYWLYWYYQVNREVRDIGLALGDTTLAQSDPDSSLTAVIFGWLLVIPPFISFFRTTRRIRRAQTLLGVKPTSGWWIAALTIASGWLYVPVLLIPMYVQRGMNRTLLAAAERGLSVAAPVAVGEADALDAVTHDAQPTDEHDAIRLSDQTSDVLDVNSAPLAALKAMPGLASDAAERIVMARHTAAFSSLADLALRAALKPHEVERLRTRIAFGSTPAVVTGRVLDF